MAFDLPEMQFKKNSKKPKSDIDFSNLDTLFGDN